MNIRSPLCVLLLVTASLLLSGCQMTTFAVAPLPVEGCDQALSGRWLSLDEDPAKNGEVVLNIDGHCQLVMESREKDGVRRSEPTRLSLGHSGLYRYAWVDAGWALRQFDEKHAVPDGDVYVVRIAMDTHRLTLWTTNDKAVAHAIIDGELQGDVQSLNRNLFNRLAGNETPAVLDHPALFNTDPVQFLRQTGTSQ